jgi:hypothetical protein
MFYMLEYRMLCTHFTIGDTLVTQPYAEATNNPSTLTLTNNYYGSKP